MHGPGPSTRPAASASRLLMRLLIPLLLTGSALLAGALALGESVAETIEAAPWQLERIAEGLTLKQHQFDRLFGVRQSVSILDADLSSKTFRLRFPLVKRGRKPTSELAREAGALAAVNGSFFSMPDGGASCYLVVDGERVAKGVHLQGAQPEGALAADSTESVSILAMPAEEWPETPGEPHLMAAGPLLLTGGAAVEQGPEQLALKFTERRHPRTAAGLTAQNHLLLVTIDGRSSRAAGMSIAELRQTMAALGCRAALNLDGGGSTTMWVRGKPENGVVNFPCDNQHFDHAGERPVSNVVAILAAQPATPSPPTTITAMTYNIHHGEGTDGKLDLERIAGVIRAAHPDLVALQEVDRKTERTGGVDQAAELGRLTGMRAYFGKATDFSGGEYGNAILSKLPVAKIVNTPLPTTPELEGRAVLAAHVALTTPTTSGADLLFYSTHFQSGRAGTPDRLNAAARVGELVAAQPDLPALLGGDLNARPASPPMVALAQDWQGATTATAQTPTLPAHSPRARIDYILHRPAPAWRLIQETIIDEPVASDHRPVVQVFEFRPSPDSKPRDGE